MDATYIILVVSAVLTPLSCFGCFAARKEIKCFVLAYFVVLLLFTVVLVIGGVLAYVFREQVEWTMRAEMLTELRRYNPANPTEGSTQAWRLTQTELQCCGFMTNKVDKPWQMWRYNKALNISPPSSPESTLLPSSCCNSTLRQLGETCTGASSSLYTGDCLSLAVQYTSTQLHLVLQQSQSPASWCPGLSPPSSSSSPLFDPVSLQLAHNPPTEKYKERTNKKQE